MNDDELTAILEDAGLSPYQAEAYVTLLDLGTASATAVAEACDVPDPRIYDVLRDLEDKGYVEIFQQDSLTARPNDPQEVRADLEARSSQFREAADAIEERWSRPAVKDHELTVVKQFETILERTTDMIGNAEVQVTVSIPFEELSHVADELTGAHERGVLVRVTVSSHRPGDGVPADFDFERLCTEARHRPTPSPFLVIVDRTWAAYMPFQQSQTEYGLLVNDRSHTSNYLWQFATIQWQGLEVIHRQRPGEYPRSFVDIRRSVAEIEKHLEAGATVSVEVIGHLVDTGEPVELSGTATDVIVGPDGDGEDPMEFPEGPVSFTLESEDGSSHEVSGWGALLEDVESTRVTVTDVSRH